MNSPSLLIGLSLLLLASPALAESPPECSRDADCHPGKVCTDRVDCVSAADLCKVSGDCPGGKVCGQDVQVCPVEGDRCASGSFGLCWEVPEPACLADSACADDELCWAIDRPACAAGDVLCQQFPTATCVNWHRFCGHKEYACSAQEACIEGRCIWLGSEEAAGNIERDADKEARLRPIWEQGPCAVEPTGCDEPGGRCGCSSSPGGALVLGALLHLLCWRRRRALRESP